MQNMENDGSSTEVEHNSGTESSELQTNGAINSSQPNVSPFKQTILHLFCHNIILENCCMSNKYIVKHNLKRSFVNVSYAEYGK